MRHWYLPIVCAGIALILIGVYFFHFANMPLSDSTSDGGAWGSYVNIGARFEEHYHVALKTAKELFEQENEIVRSVCDKIERHFRNPFDPYQIFTTRNYFGRILSTISV